MGLETGTFLDALVVTNPLTSDFKSEGDDHLRLIKTVLKNTLPGMTGRIWRSAARTSGYTVLLNDNMTHHTFAAAGTLNFTAAATLGNGHATLVDNNSTGNVTLDPNAAELINGAATLAIGPGESAFVICDGTAFHALTPLSLPFSDAGALVKNASDTTKLIRKEAANITTGTTRVEFSEDTDVAIANTWVARNLTLVASVAGNALTVALKTAKGTDPSATDPIMFKFRGTPVASGAYVTRKLTTALSMTVSSGSTLGTVDGKASRVYVGIADNAGTLQLFVWQPFDSVNKILFRLPLTRPTSGSNEGGAGGADSPITMYSSASFTLKAIQLIGWVESTQATAGTWATAPETVHVYRPGEPFTGDRVLSFRKESSAVSSFTQTIPYDDTIPQSPSEGFPVLSQVAYLESAPNIIEVEFLAHLNHSTTANQFIAALHLAALAPNAVATFNVGRDAAANAPTQIRGKFVYQPGSTANMNWQVYCGSNTAGTTTFNGSAATRTFGGTQLSYLEVTEYRA